MKNVRFFNNQKTNWFLWAFQLIAIYALAFGIGIPLLGLLCSAKPSPVATCAVGMVIVFIVAQIFGRDEVETAETIVMVGFFIVGFLMLIFY